MDNDGGKRPKGTWFGRIKKRFWDGERDGKIYNEIFRMTWPAFIELFLASMFGVIDFAMVGHMGNTEALKDINITAAMSGIGITSQPFNILIAVLAAINVGTTTLISWSFGAGKRKEMSFVARQAVLFSSIVGLALMGIGILGNRSIMNFMSPDAEAVEFGITYMRIMCWGLPFQAVTMCINAALRGCGQTRIPMFYNVGANLLDVFLNYAMVYGKFGFAAMGVEGAALSTSIVRALACIAALLILIFWKNSPIRLRVRESWKPDWKIMKQMVTIGLPAAGEQLVLQTGLMMYQKIIAALGTAEHSAHQVACNVNGMAWSISQAFSVCTNALVGHSIGADDPGQAVRYTVLARRMARVSTAVVAVLFVIFARPLVTMFTPEPDVIKFAIPIIWIVALIQYVQSALMCTAGALRGAGDTMYPLYASLLGVWVFRIAIAYFLADPKYMNWGLVGAWCAFVIDQVVRGVFINMRFKSGKWRDLKKKKHSAFDDEAVMG